MAREAVAKTNFNSGEFSPRVFGRTDVDKYYNGVARMKNFLPLPFGGAERTPGTIYVNEVRDSAKPTRIFDWVFGSRQAYILQFNDSKIRFYKDHGIVLGGNAITITGITNANPGVVTANAHGLSNGDLVTLNGIDGMSEVNGVEYKVANVTANTFELTDKDTGANINTTSFGTFIATSATIALYHLDTNFVDSSSGAHDGTAIGSAAITSDFSKFGAGSVELTGSNDHVKIADFAALDIGTGDLTIDLWAYFTSSPSARTLFCLDSTANGIDVTVVDTTTIRVFIAGSSWDFAVPTLTTGAWYHIAVTRSGTSLRVFLNGTQAGTTQTSSQSISSTAGIYIGNRSDFGSGMVGYMDEVRLMNVARWTAAFTAPTAPSVVGEGSSVQGIYEIAHTYDDDELFDIQTAQAGDIMYLAHGDNFPQKLSRFDDDDWTIANVAFVDGPYLDQNTTATTLNPSGTSGSVTVVASAITGINDDTGFQTTDVGRLIRYYDGTNWFWMTITARASTTSVTATIEESATMGNSDARTTWRLGAWSDTTGYPRAVAFFQGALWWAGTRTQPQHVWRSVVFEYENMDEGAADAADALVVPCNSDRTNIIKWLTAGKRLFAGTEGENFSIWSGVQTGTAITPANVKADPETNYGSSGVFPVKIGSYIYYIQDDDVTLREFYYDFGIDSYRSVNKSILAEHITRGLVKQLSYQKAPYGVVYLVLEDGKLATFTREIEQEVNGWADQTPRAGDTYESTAAIPADGGYTEVWFVMERQINGSTKQYIEYQANPNQARDADLEDMILMQSALTFEGSALIISGLEHLAGEAVQVMVDGVEVTGKTVSAAGLLTLDSASARIVQVGLKNTGQIKLLPLEAGSTIGSSQGMVKKTSSVFARVYRSLGLTAGEDGGNMEPIFTDGNGAALTSLQTDDFEVPSTLGWDAKQQLLFENDTPYPTTLLMVVLYEFTTEENLGA